MNGNDPTHNPVPAPSAHPYTAPVATMRDPRAKSPALAAVLSCMPGLGQVYVGYYGRGFVHAIVVASIIAILASMDHGPEPGYVPLLVMFMAFFWLYNVIDAGRLASMYNQVLAGGREPELPEGFGLPGLGGSVLGGSVLIAAGFIVLLHTRFGVSLDWVGEWWPIFPMLFGAYLLGKALMERQGKQF